MAALQQVLWQEAFMLMFPLLLLCCFTLTLLALMHLATASWHRRGAQHDRLPPSPPGLPVIGHLHHLMASPAPPHVALRDLDEKHGADGLMLLRLGRVPTLVVSSPRAAEAVLHTHDLAFASRPRSAVADIVFGGATDVGFAPYGEYWRKARRLVTEHLLSSGKVQSFRRAREEGVRVAIAKIHGAGGAGAVVDMSEVLRSFVLDLISRAVSGRLFRPEKRWSERFRKLTDETVELMGGFNLENYFPGIAKVPLLERAVCRRAEKLKERWDELLDELIDHHAAKPSGADCNRREEEEDGDFIDVLLSVQEEYGLTRVNIKAILLDMFIAGSDTSYIVLEFAMAELIRKPYLLNKLQDEVRMNMPNNKEMVTEDDIPDMAYLKAIIKETLRLHPPGALTPHLSTTKCNVLERHMVPNGTHVIVNAWAIGRYHSFWERADKFLPERFLDGGDATIIDFKGRDFQFLPFGSGRRMCPGMNFGMASIEIMLANLVYCFDWELPPGMNEEDVDMTDVFGITVRRKEKLLLVPSSYAFVLKEQSRLLAHLCD